MSRASAVVEGAGAAIAQYALTAMQVYALHDLTTSQSTNTVRTLRNHDTSRLLRLPAELRNQVYTYLIGHGSVHICPGYACSRCLKNSTRPVGPDGFILCQNTWHYPRHLLAITQTCREVHAETGNLPFVLSKLIGWYHDVIPALSTRTRLIKTQLDAITSLQMHTFWFMVWDMKRDLFTHVGYGAPHFNWVLPGLRKLDVVMEGRVNESEIMQWKAAQAEVFSMMNELVRNTPQHVEVKISRPAKDGVKIS
jgi:hypothetical protein